LSLHPLSEADAISICNQLHELQVEHRDLDLVIAYMMENPPPDELLIRRLKKRKLGLRDRIILLEEMLTPDIPA